MSEHPNYGHDNGLKADEVTIGGSNFFRVTEDELEDVHTQAAREGGESNFVRDADGNVVAWLDKSGKENHLSLSCESVPEDPGRPLTVAEILFGDGSGRPVRGIMSAMVEAGAFDRKFPPGYQNRAARRAARKKARTR